MLTLHILPAEVMSMMADEGIALSTLTDVAALEQALSVNDMADIQLATRRFPFSFDPETTITVAPGPQSRLRSAAAEDNPFEDVSYRVNERVATLQLQEEASSDEFVSQYTLYPVDESVWVAAEQRLRVTDGDPDRRVLSLNHAFFDAMIAHALHTLSFEQVCATNLFAYYLDTLPAHAA